MNLHVTVIQQKNYSIKENKDSKKQHGLQMGITNSIKNASKVSKAHPNISF